jgi:hypothetical protein
VDVLNILQFSQMSRTPETLRTQALLEQWIQNASALSLSNFLQCATGQWGLTEGLTIQVHTTYLIL